MSNIISYSTKAKAHELTLLSLKSQKLDNLSPEDIANKYLEIYESIYTVLEKDKKTNSKSKARFE